MGKKQEDWQRKSGSQQTGQKKSTEEVEDRSADATDETEEGQDSKSRGVTNRRDMDEDEDTSSKHLKNK